MCQGEPVPNIAGDAAGAVGAAVPLLDRVLGATEQEAVPSAALAGGAEAQGASVLESPAAPAAPEPESQGKAEAAEPSGPAAEEIQFI